MEGLKTILNSRKKPMANLVDFLELSQTKINDWITQHGSSKLNLFMSCNYDYATLLHKEYFFSQTGIMPEDLEEDFKNCTDMVALPTIQQLKFQEHIMNLAADKALRLLGLTIVTNSESDFYLQVEYECQLFDQVIIFLKIPMKAQVMD